MTDRARMAAAFGNCHGFTQRSCSVLEPSESLVANAQRVQDQAQLHKQRERFQNCGCLGEALHALDELTARECAVPKREVGEGDGLGGCTRRGDSCCQ